MAFSKNDFIDQMATLVDVAEKQIDGMLIDHYPPRDTRCPIP